MTSENDLLLISLGYNLCMSTPILVTKFFVPAAGPDLVSRPRLTEQINRGLHCKLTLISAPAGFGKTTVATEWIQANGGDASSPFCKAWLSLDEGDNDPVRFLTYLTTALNQVERGDNAFGEKALALLQAHQPPTSEMVLIELINDLTAFSGKIVLVLDDYHLVESQVVHSALEFLLENLPPQLHMVITTREDPPLPLSRLRVLRQLNELRATDLCFTSAEVAEFLNQVMGLDLKPEDIAVLEARTEGWIAGLQLAALSMQGSADTSGFIQSFAGSNRLVLDYLIDEVLEQQSPDLQTFLLLTSILDRLSGSLCDAVCFGSAGSANGQEMLETLERANLFIIPLDEERCWYRYHHLFADLLRQRLRQTQPDQLTVIHRRASEWYAGQGFADDAIDHALRGGDIERAADLIDINVGGNYEEFSPQYLQRWLTAMPADFISTKTHLCLLQAWNQFTLGQWDDAEQSLQLVDQLLETDDQLLTLERDKLCGRTAAIRAFIASYGGDLPGSIRFALQALDICPAEELAWRSSVAITLGDAYAAQGQITAAYQIRLEALEMSKSSGDPFIQMIANLNLAETLWQQGQSQQVIEICERQMKIAEKHGKAETAIVGWLLGLWGTALTEINDLDRSLKLTKKGVELAEAGRGLTYICFSNLHRVRVLFSAGELSAAEMLIQKLAQAANESDLPLWTTSQVAAWQTRIWLAQGKFDAAAQWVINHGLEPTDEFPFESEPKYIALSRILLAQGQLSETSDLLKRLRSAAEVGGRYLRVVELCLLQALTAQSDGESSLALAYLTQAIEFAIGRGIIRTFVDEGPALARLLYEAVKQEIEPEFVQRLIAAFPAESPEPARAAKFETGEWVEPLTDRELEILQRIAEGLTNKEIGSRLYLSANTIKAHLRNVYGKLNVNNRTQAVAKGRSLGIILDH